MAQVKIDLKTTADTKGIDKTSSALKGVQRESQNTSSFLGNMGKSLSGTSGKFAGFGLAINGVKAAFGFLQSAFSTCMDIFSRSYTLEKTTQQFKTLIGNIDEARVHMEMLKELGKTPPFSLEELAATSRTMMTVTNGVLGYKDSLILVGDAAAATGKPLDSVGQAVSRMYQNLNDGTDIKRCANEMKNLGLITPGVAQEIVNMSESGKDAQEIWQVVTTQLQGFKGAMDDVGSGTGGQVEAMKGAFSTLKDTILEKIADESSQGIGELTKAVQDLAESGAWASLAEVIGKIISGLAQFCAYATTIIDSFKPVTDFLSDMIEQFEQFGELIGGLIGGGEKGYMEVKRNQRFENDAKGTIAASDQMKQAQAKKEQQKKKSGGTSGDGLKGKVSAKSTEDAQKAKDKDEKDKEKEQKEKRDKYKEQQDLQSKLNGGKGLSEQEKRSIDKGERDGNILQSVQEMIDNIATLKDQVTEKNERDKAESDAKKEADKKLNEDRQNFLKMYEANGVQLTEQTKLAVARGEFDKVMNQYKDKVGGDLEKAVAEATDIKNGMGTTKNVNVTNPPDIQGAVAPTKSDIVSAIDRQTSQLQGQNAAQRQQWADAKATAQKQGVNLDKLHFLEDGITPADEKTAKILNRYADRNKRDKDSSSSVTNLSKMRKAEYDKAVRDRKAGKLLSEHQKKLLRDAAPWYNYQQREQLEKKLQKMRDDLNKKEKEEQQKRDQAILAIAKRMKAKTNK